MGEEAGTKWVAGVQALHSGQIAGNLHHAFPETQRQEVQGQSVGIKITFPSSGLQHLQMVHCHLEDFCLLQFSGTLLLKRCGNKPP